MYFAFGCKLNHQECLLLKLFNTVEVVGVVDVVGGVGA